MKNKEEIEQKYFDIFNKIEDYVLIRSSKPNGGYVLYHVPRQGFVMIEYDHDALIEKLLKKKIKIVNHQDEVKIEGFDAQMVRWDDEKKEWVKGTSSEFLKLRDSKK